MMDKIYPPFPRKKGRPTGRKNVKISLSLPDNLLAAIKRTPNASKEAADALEFYYRNRDDIRRLKEFEAMALSRGMVLCQKCGARYSILKFKDCPECHKTVALVLWGDLNAGVYRVEKVDI